MVVVMNGAKTVRDVEEQTHQHLMNLCTPKTSAALAASLSVNLYSNGCDERFESFTRCLELSTTFFVCFFKRAPGCRGLTGADWVCVNQK